MRVRTIGRKISAKYNFLRNFLHPPLIILSVPRSNYKTDLKNIPSLANRSRTNAGFPSLSLPFPKFERTKNLPCWESWKLLTKFLRVSQRERERERMKKQLRVGHRVGSPFNKNIGTAFKRGVLD